MAKYTRVLKLFISKQGIEGKSSRDLAKQFSINSRLIRYWVSVYKIHGEESFLPDPHSKYAEYKLRALKLMWTNGWSINQTSAILNLSSPSAVSRWLQRFNEDGLRGLKGKPIENASMTSRSNTTKKPDDEMTNEELKEELAYLRAEMAVLKKYEELKQKKRPQTKKMR
ncbi:helix-turn-helix domain-containing protein [Colwelliaceae bacterium BS250]